MNYYQIDVQGLKELEAQFARHPAVVEMFLGGAVAEADLLLAREVMDRMPTAHGTLRSSVFHEEQVNDTGVTGLVSTPLAYAVPVELGTKPHFPPIEPLMDWVKVKFGISDEKTARGVAFAVARKIAVRGTVGQFPFQLAFLKHEDQVRQIFDRAVARIAENLAGGEA